jgi:ACS family hexuronate transporter-like MFS transporter
VSGMGGTAAGIGTIIAFKLVGYISDTHQGSSATSFDWVLIVAGLIPLAGMVLVLFLVRNTKATEKGLVRRL